MRKILNHFDGSVFAVYKQGVYGHGVHAIARSVDDAKDLANLAAAREPDDYHSFHVFSIPLNILPPQANPDPILASPSEDSGWMAGASLYSVAKTVELSIPLDDSHSDVIVGLTADGVTPVIDGLDEFIRSQIERQLASHENAERTSRALNLDAPPLEIPLDIPLVFLVYKRGNFGHGIHGASDDLTVAMDLAIHAAKRDVDNYHSYEVYTVPVGMLPVLRDLCSIDHGWMNRDPVASFTLDGQSAYGARRRPTVRKAPLSIAEQQHQQKLFPHHA